MSDIDWRPPGAEAGADAGEPKRPGDAARPREAVAGPPGPPSVRPVTVPPPPPRLSQQPASEGYPSTVRPPAFHQPHGQQPHGRLQSPATRPLSPYPPPVLNRAAAGSPAAGYPSSGRRTPDYLASGSPAVPGGFPGPGPHRDPWPTPVRPPAWLASPALPQSADRPTYREPLPVRAGRVAAGIGLTTLWMILFGLFAGTARAYVWLAVAAGALAWLTAWVLGRFGDRGVAVGVAVAGGVGVAAGALVVTLRLVNGGEWFLW